LAVVALPTQLMLPLLIYIMLGFQFCGLSVSTHVESVFMAFTLFIYVPGTVMFLPAFHIILLSAMSHCLNKVMSATQLAVICC